MEKQEIKDLLRLLEKALDDEIVEKIVITVKPKKLQQAVGADNPPRQLYNYYNRLFLKNQGGKNGDKG